MYPSAMMSYRVVLVGLLTLFLTLGGAPSSWAQAQSTEVEIRQMLEQRDQEIKSILGSGSNYTAQQRERLKELIGGVIDYRAMGQTALGPHWDELTAEQHQEFVEVFRDVVQAQSMSDLEVYNSQVTFDQIDVQGDSAYVRTMTQYQGTWTPVEYVLTYRDGEWLAEDIIVDDVSTAEGYARSFQTVIRQRGFEALMESLRKKRSEIRAQNEAEPGT